jgi:hypothetical protein
MECQRMSADVSDSEDGQMKNQFDSGRKPGLSEDDQGNTEAEPTKLGTPFVNEGEINFPEKHPLDPLSNHDAEVISHKGGLTSQRTEFY